MAESEMYALSVLEEWMTISPPLRQVLAENLRALMNKRPDLGGVQAIEDATAKRGCKIGKSTVHRVMNGETPLNLEYVEVLAKVFEVAPWQLLIHGLDPDNPQVLREFNEAEASLYKRMADLAKEIAKLPEAPK